MRHRNIHLIAQTLCECDGADWKRIGSAERDRYARIAILVDDRLRELESAGEAQRQALAGLTPEPRNVEGNA